VRRVPRVDPVAAFARNVKQTRAERELTQEAVAGAIGMDPAQFGKIERGEVDPSVRTVARIAKGLGVPPADLLAGVEAG
jgi:transcriptional regulator with XRE-family HTH domain